MKTFTLEISKETCDTLQRCAYEVMTRQGVVARMIEDSKDAVDASVLDSVPFKHYHGLLEDAVRSYDTEKHKLEESLKPRVLEHEGKDVAFQWAVNDFSIHEALITVED